MNLKELQGATEPADSLYEFLPGKSHLYGKQGVSFPGCAAKMGLSPQQKKNPITREEIQVHSVISNSTQQHRSCIFSIEHTPHATFFSTLS